MSLRKSGSQVFLLLSALSREELEEFRDFLHLSFAGGGETLRQLLDLFIPLHPGFPEAEVSKEAMHRRLFPDLAFNDKRMRNLYSDLSIQLREYFAWKAFRRDRELQKVLRVDEFRRRGLGTHAQKEGARMVSDHLDASGARGFLFRFQVEDLLYQMDDLEETLLWEAQKDLDRFFVLSKMRLSAVLLSRRGYLSGKSEGEMVFLEEAKEYAEAGCRPDLLWLYRSVIALLEGPFDEVLFREVREAFLESVPRLAREDRRVLYQCLINITLWVINERDASFIRRSWELYKAGLENGLVFSSNGELSDTTFTNIVVNGANLGEFEWTAGFIDTYASRLAPEVRDNAVALGRAYWHYNQAEYGRVIELLRNVQYTSVAYALRGRSLLLRTYFDQGMADNWVFSNELFYLLEAFRRYLHRNKTLSEGRKTGYQNFLNFTLALVQVVSLQKSEKALLLLEQEILSTSQVIAKEWLLQRLEAVRRKMRGNT